MEHVTPATRLLEKRRQMFDVQESLEHQKVEFNRKEDGFKKREQGLKKKDLELQESLIKFSKFLQETDAKRNRADKKSIDERRLRVIKEGDIVSLKALLDELKAEKESTSTVVEKNMRYQKYLEQVLDIADQYHEISDLLMRFATLEATNGDLRQQAKGTSETNEATRAELQTYTKTRTDEILNLNNKISRKKKDLEEKERICFALESKKDYAMQAESQKRLQHGQVCMATENLSLRCKDASKLKHPEYNKPIDQLSFIGEFMVDMASIIKQYKASTR